MSVYTIKELPIEERPRERLMRHGPESMSTSEIIAVILGSGTRGKHVLELSQELMIRFGGLKQIAEASIRELCQVHGLGPTKAIQLKACLCLATRMKQEPEFPKFRIDHPSHAYHLVKDDLESEKREVVVGIFLDVRNCVICHEVISIGTLSSSVVHPRELYHPAVRHKAASVILAHNHPSGDPSPSPEDFEVTKAMIDAGDTMGIPLQDHIVVGKGSFVSLRAKGVWER